MEYKIEQEGHAEDEQEGVGLEIAGLHEPQGATDQIRRSPNHHQPALNNPAIKPSHGRRDHIMPTNERGFIEFIEIEPFIHAPGQRAQLGGQGISGGILVDCPGQEQAGGECDQPERHRDGVEERLKHLLQECAGFRLARNELGIVAVPNSNITAHHGKDRQGDQGMGFTSQEGSCSTNAFYKVH